MTDTEKKPTQFQVALDIEKISNTRPNAWGLFVGDDQGNTHFKSEWWTKIEEEDIDERCKREFWDKYPEVLKDALSLGEDEGVQVRSFVAAYDAIHSHLKVEEKDLKLISDNAECDYGGMTPLVKKYCNREPLRFTKKREKDSKEGTYRPITELDEIAWKLGVGEIIEKHADEIQVHDHHPSNDAEHNWVEYLITREFAERVKAKFGDELKRIAEESSKDVVSKIKRARIANNQ